ncbi:MAG: aminotransferase class V-fold PLP-dependent enzyme, partial [Myxococcota bacterium]|nr:aminotransferase class V-fold PLP-dependent enzyme [Myxococcota bacterium]
EAIAAFVNQVTPRTRLALVDQVTSPTALVLPVADIVEALQSRGVDVLVDAAHGPGIVPLDLDAVGAAYTTGNCHKWLCTPKGAAFLHVRRDRQTGLRPLNISHGATQPLGGRSRFRVEFDWPGTDDPTAWLCIPDAIRDVGAMMDGGWESIRERNRQLTLGGRRVLADALGVSLPCPDEMVSAIATLILPDGFGATDGADWTSDPLHERLLDDHRIQVPVFPWPDLGIRCLRISSQLYNHADEVKHLGSVLRSLA